MWDLLWWNGQLWLTLQGPKWGLGPLETNLPPGPPGLYHLGVMKALHDADMLPYVICATELGAALAALVCMPAGWVALLWGVLGRDHDLWFFFMSGFGRCIPP